jgi:hypothetical protein
MADGKGAEGSGIPRAQIGILHLNIHRVIIHIKFFGQQLGNRCHGTLTHLYLSGIKGDPVIGPDSQKGIEIGGDSAAEETGARPAGEKSV